MGSRQTLEMPPFPTLTWDRYSWEGAAKLGAWAGSQSRLGPYGSESSDGPSDGTVRVVVSPGVGESRRPPSHEQARAFQHLLDHQSAIRDAVLGAVFAEYPSLREAYGEFSEMPTIGRPEGLLGLIGLSAVHILPIVRDGLASVGFEFGCTWDEDHGLGVLTHNGRVRAVGAADAAFTDALAYEDGGDEED